MFDLVEELYNEVREDLLHSHKDLKIETKVDNYKGKKQISVLIKSRDSEKVILARDMLSLVLFTGQDINDMEFLLKHKKKDIDNLIRKYEGYVAVDELNKRWKVFSKNISIRNKFMVELD